MAKAPFDPSAPVDLPAVLKEIRAAFALKRDRVERVPERRGTDRRGLGYTARRTDDRERNVSQRQFLFAYLHHLRKDKLWEWVQAVLLGNATDTQLAVWTKLAEASVTADGAKRRGPRKMGRPRQDAIIPGDRDLPTSFYEFENRSLRREYRSLTEALDESLSAARQKHHSRMNRSASGKLRDPQFRANCLASALGQRVEQAGLFKNFFDEKTFTPGEMAARLLHREIEQHLSRVEVEARSAAEKAPSDSRRAFFEGRAGDAAARRRKLPAWRTFYNKLRR